MSTGGSGGGVAGDVGGHPGAGRAPAGTSGSGVGGSPAGAAGSGGTVDRFGNCPAGVDYFVSIEGDLPTRKLTAACPDYTVYADAPIFDEGASLEPGTGRWEAFIACDDDEHVEVWRMPPFATDMTAAGFYAAADGRTYSSCGTTSRLQKDTALCDASLGPLVTVESTEGNGILEGSYAMTLFDEDGESYAVSGDFRVCAYSLPIRWRG